MRIAVVGAGPTGLFSAIALARRGHAVTVVDRDPGPRPDGSWERAGVMQFHHPHAFRGQVVDALLAEMPEVLDALLAAGAERVDISPGVVAGLRCRRLVFERVLRAAARAEPGVALVHGHADEVIAERGRAAGLRVDGRPLGADLVLDASGRAGRLGRGLRGPALGGDCGQAYVSRQYRLRPGAGFGPMTMPIAAVAYYPGYAAIAFPHDSGVFSAVILRSGGDRALTALRETAAFDAAAAAIPLLAAWTDPQRGVPLTGVLPGGRLRNTWCGQLGDDGDLPLPGLVFVGDTVCTTNPSAGRGVTTSLLQVRRLLDLLAEHPGDPESLTRALDAWCTAHVKPWFDDHVACDAGLAARWAGADVDLGAPLPPDLVGAAATVDPSMMAVVGPYQAMQALPGTLAQVEPRAREIYATGWRPPVPDGPTRDELVDLVTRAAGQPGPVPV